MFLLLATMPMTRWESRKSNVYHVLVSTQRFHINTTMRLLIPELVKGSWFTLEFKNGGAILKIDCVLSVTGPMAFYLVLMSRSNSEVSST